MLLAKVASRGSYNCLLADHDFASLLDRLTDILFTHEVCCLFDPWRSYLAVVRFRYGGRNRRRRASGWIVAAGRQELVDSPGQSFCPQPDSWLRQLRGPRQGRCGSFGFGGGRGPPVCRRHLVRDPLDVEEMTRRVVVRRDVPAVPAAAERHRRIQTGRQLD